MDLIRECMGAKRIGIGGHIRPDGDCVGACLSLCMYLKKCLTDAEVKVFLEQPAAIFLKSISYIACIGTAIIFQDGIARTINPIVRKLI